MKRIFFPLTFLLFAIVSCKGQLDPLPDVTQDGVTLVTADLESVFNSDLIWREGSYIGLYGSESGINEKYFLKSAGIGCASAQFYGPEVLGDIVAYFPYDAAYSGSAVAMPVNLQPEQEFSAQRDSLSQFLYYSPTAFGHQENSKLKFEYPFGMLRVRVRIEEIPDVAMIRISTENLSVAGLGVISQDGSLRMDSSASKTASLSCGEGVPTKSESGKLTDFYLVLAPGEYPKMQVYVISPDGGSLVCELNGVSIERISARNFVVTPVDVTCDLSGMPQVDESFD